MATKTPLPLGSFLLMRASDGLYQGTTGSLKVVLLHGWLQSFDALLGLAQRLRDIRGADVLLLDFYAHGHSPCLPSVRMHTIPALVTQLRTIVEHVGWNGQPHVVGGMSMGASVALRYAAGFASDVQGLLLMAPSGMPEHAVSLAHVGRVTARSLLGDDVPTSGRTDNRQAGVRKRLLSKLNFIKTTPEYGIDVSVWETLRPKSLPVTVVVGSLDIVHTPQSSLWRARVPQARILVKTATHWGICQNVHDLNLENDLLWLTVSAQSNTSRL